ncbi:hypothetical protein VTO73DRAFT_12460 [Trametes versicolor]
MIFSVISVANRDIELHDTTALEHSSRTTACPNQLTPLRPSYLVPNSALPLSYPGLLCRRLSPTKRQIALRGTPLAQGEALRSAFPPRPATLFDPCRKTEDKHGAANSKPGATWVCA